MKELGTCLSGERAKPFPFARVNLLPNADCIFSDLPGRPCIPFRRASRGAEQAAGDGYFSAFGGGTVGVPIGS